MKLIINTVNLKIGGAFQRSLSFLNELKEFGKDKYYVFYNSDIGKQLDIESFPSNFSFYKFDHSPASLKYRRSIVKRFNEIQKEVNPDVVFSFVNPAYWRAKSPHLVGYAVPHIVYDDYKYVKKNDLRTKLEMAYKKFWTKYEADYHVVQTEDVRQRLSKKINIPLKNIFLVTNGIGKQYKDITPIKKAQTEVKKLLMISTFRPSKNFDIIKKVIPLLQDDIFKYEFHITIDKNDYEKNFKGFENAVINHGHVKAIEGPGLYNDADAMFLPSHLECFSASYPEAMKMEKPILTSDLSFAHTVCGDAAIYFDNMDEKDIAEKIKNLFNDKNLYDNQIKLGLEQLQIFQNSREQAESYIEICKQIMLYT
ncbi:glycosyltransferase [Halpernia sp.]|uniref:glycosyltransferase n=1 Tax=Halpernia sp. TaxID=2782209 RepID=UPI003A8F7C13